ncbi:MULTISPECIES: dUTP diphosphatase [unclassified Granulicatella]|uniref:dUTP diphosphatase n=1 Tax=unclassified Granulicatella TaxID=2630493 RepID=UPI001884818A|nr:dUTP diphosphatase [Granulicatella sp. WM01]MBF0780454.1 dUTP diphosphatase [Granulicatella sp. 19428wC4_WM01]
MMKRGFQVVKAYEDKEINLPKRATKQSAGYDFEAAEDSVVPSFWKVIFKHVALELKQWFHQSTQQTEEVKEWESALKPVLVPTGIKAYMQEDEYLQLTNRSSNPLKHFLVLTNGVGVVDADYYNNADNEGHIYFQLSNFGLRDKVIKKGERIGQGIFVPFLKADNDDTTSLRSGGFGSSGTQSLSK